MTPSARVAAAAELLDQWLAGQPLEQALTSWGRRNRYAGSGDRAAIRDLVFDAVRRRRSYAALGGGESGRKLMIGAQRAKGADLEDLFTGIGHAPAPLSEEEAAFVPGAMTMAEALDCPDWLLPRLQESLGAATAPVLEALRTRAPVFLRVNTAQIGLAEAAERLRAEGMVTREVPLADTALEVLEGARKIQSSASYRDGMVELQDAASQAVVAMLPLEDGARVLDYCAGGGGKLLAMAARARLNLHAHDIDPRRMRDLPARAARAGVAVSVVDTGDVANAGPYDLVLLDVPCSGSGSWRRSPEAKWTFTSERLDELVKMQAHILDDAKKFVEPLGFLAYVTCSLLQEENSLQVDHFIAQNPEWSIRDQRVLTPLDGGDGFFFALLQRD